MSAPQHHVIEIPSLTPHGGQVITISDISNIFFYYDRVESLNIDRIGKSVAEHLLRVLRDEGLLDLASDFSTDSSSSTGYNADSKRNVDEESISQTHKHKQGVHSPRAAGSDGMFKLNGHNPSLESSRKFQERLNEDFGKDEYYGYSHTVTASEAASDRDDLEQHARNNRQRYTIQDQHFAAREPALRELIAGLDQSGPAQLHPVEMNEDKNL